MKKKRAVVKAKTRKSASKRFSLTAKGKIKMRKVGKRHLLQKKSSKRKRSKSSDAFVSPSDSFKVRSMLPGMCS